MSHYSIKCRACDQDLKDAGCTLSGHCPDALMLTEYRDSRFSEQGTKGVWRFNWLPVHHPSTTQPGPYVYQSQNLARALGLDELYITFNGYWPEKGALLETCTFKEFEAAVVLQNARENNVKD